MSPAAKRPPFRGLALGLLGVLGIATALTGAGVWWLQRGQGAALSPGPQPVPAKYVENGVCLGCHQEEARQWRDSHHAKAMALPTAETVRGNFSNTSFTDRGVTARFFKRGDKFFVNIEGEEGKPSDFEIKYTFGLEPLQQYLIELPRGRLQPLTIAWDGPNRKWFHLYPNEKAPPGDVLHWTGRYQTANTMCLVCHTTDYEKRYDAATDTFASRWAELNVSCQACHGADSGESSAVYMPRRSRQPPRSSSSPTAASSRATARASPWSWRPGFVVTAASTRDRSGVSTQRRSGARVSASDVFRVVSTASCGVRPSRIIA